MSPEQHIALWWCLGMMAFAGGLMWIGRRRRPRNRRVPHVPYYEVGFKANPKE